MALTTFGINHVVFHFPWRGCHQWTPLLAHAAAAVGLRSPLPSPLAGAALPLASVPPPQPVETRVLTAPSVLSALTRHEMLLHFAVCCVLRAAAPAPDQRRPVRWTYCHRIARWRRCDRGAETRGHDSQVFQPRHARRVGLWPLALCVLVARALGAAAAAGTWR